jgi:hypothetical protein
MTAKKKAASTRQVGDTVVVRLHNGRIVEAVIKARIDKTEEFGYRFRSGKRPR